ncbi:MAG TPA: hypothetical protein VHW44_28080 [Pseudonocardiaceae bacterium]|jgi:hypothetical protein|nr:hypothetical protein [Pseudonocardiaceae bacterium]
MRTRQWTRRALVTGCVAGVGLTLVGVGTASAQGGSSATPAPITISSAQVEQLCQQRVPTLKSEVSQLITRIDAGPSTVGSTQWLDAQEQQATANGHQARADLLANREQRRAGVLTALQDVQTKLGDFTTAHCGYLGSGQ